MIIANVVQEPVNAKDFIFSIPAGMTLPRVVDNRNYTTTIENQGQLGSCTANATVAVLESILERAGKFTHLSRLFVYYNEREGYTNLRGKDGGAYLSDGFKTCYKFGVPPEDDWPYDEGMVNTKPVYSAYDKALLTKVTKYQRVAQYAQSNCIERIKTTLAMGYNVSIAIPVKDSIFRLHGKLSEATCWYLGIGKDVGGHAMTFVGYNDDGFITKNSWDDTWGDKGYCIVSYGVIQTSLMDAWTCTCFAGIEQRPNFNFAVEKPLTAAINDYPNIQYKLSSKDTEYHSYLLAVLPDGDGPFSYEWTTSDPSVTMSPEQFSSPAIDLSSWAEGEVRSITCVCTVKDSSIPAQETTVSTLIRVCNSVDIESNYGKIYRLYKACLNRIPDNDGIKYWVGQLETGMDLKNCAIRFMDSDEFKTLYGTTVLNKDFAYLCYKNVLNREPEPEGYAWWLGKLNEGYAKEDMLVGFSESNENKSGSMW
jgi:hypothetical protein